MRTTLQLEARDKSLLFVLLSIMTFAVLFASLFLPGQFLLILFNSVFLFSIVFYLMLFLYKKDLGKAKSPKNFPSVTIVIPVYNSLNTIKQCIDTVKKIKYPGVLEIMAIDDCSTDGSRQLMEKMKGIKLIKMEQNSGKATAMNHALQKIKTEFVVCIDSDSYPEENILLKTMGYFEDDQVAAVTCLVLPDKNKTLIQKVQYLEYIIGFGLANTLMSAIDSTYVAPGPMTVFRRSIFDKVGYYEADNLTEDMDLGLRFKKHGLKIMTCYEAVVYTDVPKRWKDLFVQRTRWYRGGVFNFLKHKSLFFNKKNPNFGFFVLPFVFVSQLLTIAVLIRMLVFFVRDFVSSVSILVNYWLLGGWFTFDPLLMILPSSFLFFATTYLLVTIYFGIGFSMVKYSPKLSDLFALLVLIFIYPYFITFTYSQSYFKEMLGVRTKWLRVST